MTVNLEWAAMSDIPNPKIIAIFNHKGGVSKTTTAFHLGWKLAQLGMRVILADFDPQCNLTGMVLGYKGIEDFDQFYSATPPNNIKDGLSPAFESKPKSIVGIDCAQVPKNEYLLLAPGHIGLAEYETTLGIAQELSGSLLPLRNLPGSFRFLLNETGKKYEADYIILDMSPSLGPINQNLLMTSDFFLVPLHPDFFSSMALNSLSKTLPRWKNWADAAYATEILTSADYPFPAPNAKFVGAIVQKYRPRGGKASSAFQRWIDQLTSGLQTELVPALEKAGLVDSIDFQSRVGSPPHKPIMEVSDFNSLIAESQEHQVPVYGLTPELLKQKGAVWEQNQASMEVFDNAFSDCAKKIIALTA
jgi:cellulose biosynthesis protein BcsQ